MVLNLNGAKLALVSVYVTVVSAYATVAATLPQAGIDIIKPNVWLQYGSLGVLALYIVLHWMERRDQRQRMEPVLRELTAALEGLKVLVDERLPRDGI